LLEVQGLNASYGLVRVLHDINISVPKGAIVSLVGANAAGKTSLMFSLAGLRTQTTGEIMLAGERLDQLPAYERINRGLVLIPERRRLFPYMTVLENLELGAFSARTRERRRETLEDVFRRLPLLAERRGQIAGSLSGGEQQMVAIGRALMSLPQVLLLDEPTEGLAPMIVKQVFDLVQELREAGFTILIVEQNVHHVLKIVDYAYVLETGRIVLEGRGDDLLKDERLRVAYLGM
jgi:branched-chain amino acid transport system ATP-binding protein